jgi:hypothetical protein
VKPFLWGALAGYVLACLIPLRIGGMTNGAPGNLRGNAGGFTGGNPGTPEGPGFYR